MNNWKIEIYSSSGKLYDLRYIHAKNEKEACQTAQCIADKLKLDCIECKGTQISVKGISTKEAAI